MKCFKGLILTLSLLAATSIQLQAQSMATPDTAKAEPLFTISSDLAINSQYVWRGFLLDSDTVMQPGIYVSGQGLTFSLWSSFDMQSDDALDSDEIDYSIDYTKEFDNYSISVGFTYYDFPEVDSYSKEFYFGVALDTFLSPSFTWYHDIGDEDNGGGDGDYFLFSIAHTIDLKKHGMTLDLGANLGFNNELFIEGSGGDFTLTAGLNIPINDYVTVTPNISYSIPFGDLSDKDDGDQDNEFYAGMLVAYVY